MIYLAVAIAAALLAATLMLTRRPPPAELHELQPGADALDIAVHKVQGVVDRVADIEKLIDTVRRLLRAGGCLAAAFVLILAALKIQADDIVAARSAARVGACQQDNPRIDQHNTLEQATATLQTEIDNVLAFATHLPDGVVLTPDQQARRDAFNALTTQQRDAVLAALARSIVANRECTQEAISAYLSTTTTTTGGR